MFLAPFSFDGRIRRLEYGISYIIYFVSYQIVGLLLLKVSAFFWFLYIPLLWFLWAQGAKRCHDRGNSAWYQLIPFYVFWLLFADGDYGYNEYGNDPKNREGLGIDGNIESLIDKIGQNDEPQSRENPANNVREEKIDYDDWK